MPQSPYSNSGNSTPYSNTGNSTPYSTTSSGSSTPARTPDSVTFITSLPNTPTFPRTPITPRTPAGPSTEQILASIMQQQSGYWSARYQNGN